MNPTTFTYQLGSEQAPDDPIGLELVRLDSAGQLFYERRQRGQVWRKVVQLEGSAQERLNEAIAKAKTVRVPDLLLPPGATLVQIGFGEQQALLDYFQAKKLPSYGRLVQLMDEHLRALREDGAA